MKKTFEGHNVEEAKEAYRNKVVNDSSHPASKVMKKGNKILADELLKKPDFIDICAKDIQRRVAGEEETIKALIIILGGGILTINAKPTSKNLIVNDESGAGKDFLIRNVLEIFPQEKVVKRKRITEKVMCYWHNAKFEPQWNWTSKILYVEDMTSQVLNCDVVKVLSSNEDKISWSTIVINNMAVDIGVRGKPFMLTSIAKAYLATETLRRYPLMNLDATEEQNRRVVDKINELEELDHQPVTQGHITEAFAKLKEVKVKIPYVKKLGNLISTKHIIIRTQYSRILDYIRFSCALHQFQREVDAQGKYLATKEDYETALTAIRKTTSNVFSIPLPKNQKKLLALFEEAKGAWLNVGDLAPKVTWYGERSLRKDLALLQEHGFLQAENQGVEGVKKPVIHYKLVDSFNINLPSWQEIEKGSSNSINTSNASNTINSNDSNDSVIHEVVD